MTTLSNLPPIRACIFDSDGLLINSEDIYSVTINQVLHEYGLPDIPWSVKAAQQSRGRQGFINVMDWAKLPISVDEFMAEVSVNREPFRQCQPLPGVHDLLQTLSQRTAKPIYLAIASSRERNFFHLKTENFAEVLSVVPDKHHIFGDDPCMSGCKGKPAPDIFIQSLQRLNDALPKDERLIEPLECLVFEDSIAGVETGRNAGMRVAWVPHPGLLEAYQGQEGMVMAGKLDEKGMVCGPSEEDLQKYLPFSEDGRIELITSLEDFPYQRYGIELSE